MGLFSKVWKGVKKGFKKIGKGIKSAFKKFGKFMGKIGVFGQIAMMFILPGIGGALMKGLGSAFSGLVGTAGTTAATAGATAATTAGATAATTAASTAATTAATTAASTAATTAATTAGTGMLGSSSALIRGAGKVLEAAGNFVKVGHSAFQTVTQGITSFVGEMGKTALNKIPGINISSAATDFSGAWANVQENIMTNAGKTINAFNEAIGYTPTPAPVTTATPTMATTSTTTPTATTTASTATETFGPMKEGYAMPETPSVTGVDKPYIDIPNAKNSLMSKPVTASTTANTLVPKTGQFAPNFGPRTEQFSPNFGPQPDSRGLFEKATDYVGDVYDNAVTKVSKGFEDFRTDPVGTLVGEDPIGKAYDTASEQVTGLLAQRGIMGKPQPVRQYVTQVAAFEPYVDMDQFKSPEINARIYEMNTNYGNFTANNVYGFPANQAYANTMARLVGTGG